MELDLSGYNIKISDDMNTWEEVNLLYNAALKQIQTKIEILNDEFQEVHRYNPIEHVKYRVKGPESIVKKLKRNGYKFYSQTDTEVAVKMIDYYYKKYSQLPIEAIASAYTSPKSWICCRVPISTIYLFIRSPIWHIRNPDSARRVFRPSLR